MKKIKMSQRMLKALQGSIKKWEKILDGTGIDDGENNCPLCKAYPKGTCGICPVNINNPGHGCVGTPYTDWDKHHTNDHGTLDSSKIKCDICKVLAQKELDFLRSLLPVEK